MTNFTIQQQVQELSFGIEHIAPEGSLKKKLAQAEKEGRKLVIKLGFDPTAPDLHLGHAVVLKKLKQFQDFGHHIILIIGSFTAQIGDPTGKSVTRPQLTPADVEENTKTYLDQLEKILDISKVEIRYNSEWLEPLNLKDIISLLSKYTVARILERDDFKKRITNGDSIAMHEMLYPLMQGYDSTVINSDVELGGTDQLLNCLVGRHLQQINEQNMQIVMTVPLLVGLDGSKKMSKSLGNYIGLHDSPRDMFGKMMSVGDDLLESYIVHAAEMSVTEKEAMIARLQTENPMIIKKELAHNIVLQYHGSTEADNAVAYFEDQFQSKTAETKTYDPVKVSFAEDFIGIVDLAALLLPGRSKSDLRRLITGGGVTLHEEKVDDVNAQLQKSDFPIDIKLGKKHYFAVEID